MGDQAVFCPRCGRALEAAEVEGRTRLVCPACGFILYQNPVPGVGVLVETDGGIVLVRRAQPPFAGSWALPAGYIEADESAEAAALRECREETGLQVELVELFGVYSFPEGPVQSGLIIFYRARPVGGSLQAGSDAAEARVFAPDALPKTIAFRTHREVLARWVRTRAVAAAGPRGDEVAIRDAEPQDEPAVLRLLRLIPAGANADAGEPAALLRFRERAAMDVLVAERRGEVVGFLALSFVPTLSGLRALIGDMAVDPAHRRRGIGMALLEAAIQRASRRGATYLLVDTSRADEAAREFYQACGFETRGVTPLRIR